MQSGKTGECVPQQHKMDQARVRLGFVFAIVSTLGLGLAIALSRFAYEGGSNGLTVSACRSVLMLVAVGLFCMATGRRLWITPRDFGQTVGLGVLMGAGFYGNVGAVQYIPISLAAILFFLFPPLIGLIHVTFLRERPGWIRSIAILLAFLGVVMMIGVVAVQPDWRGVVLSLGAAVAVAWNAVWIQRRVPHVDPVVLVFHMGVVAAVMLSSLALLGGQVQWPHSFSGWLGLAAVGVLQSACLPIWYLALARIGSLQAGMLTNLQPIVTMTAAYLLFNEIMGIPQFVGAGMILIAVFVMQNPFTWGGFGKKPDP
jgi:DME family drug/metabolite transporter